jgi:hypothetical protein
MALKCDTKAILPEKYDLEELIAATPRAMREIVKLLLADFVSTADTWDHKPTFDVATTKETVTVSTTDENWIRIDQGTTSKGYIQARRRPSGRRFFRIVKRARKTKPGQIKAMRGGPTGEVRFRGAIRHKGITPRDFTGMIRKKYEKDYPRLISLSIQEGLKRGVSVQSEERKVQP